MPNTDKPAGRRFGPDPSPGEEADAGSSFGARRHARRTGRDRRRARGRAGRTRRLAAAAHRHRPGQFVRLTLDAAAGRQLDRPDYTTDRYVRNHQGHTTLDVTAPADLTAVGDSVDVAGPTVAGNRVVVAATNTDKNSGTVTRATTAASDGSFSVTVPLTGGTWVLSIVATSPSGDTAYAKRTVVFDFVPGTLLFEAADPDNDDNGPGNHAYPTSDNFKPGAFDLQQFQVFDDGTNIIFRVRTRNLSPTFGSPLGAQLVDVYVHDPGATTMSTAPAFTQRNYTIAPGGAWSKRIEVQGFGEQYVDAGGASLGDVAISGNAVSRYITFSVTKASLGQPGPGWGFTVVLTGQEGGNPDQARDWTATPQEFRFGVCAAPSTDPHCTVDPATVPKAMDVITPAGTSQGTELDYTLGPVVLQPVVMP
jgi:hypothetical protein